MQPMIVRPANLKPAVGIGKTLAYAKINPESSSYDPTFPKPVKLSTRCVGWRLDELQAWIEQRQRAGGQ